MDGFQPLPLDTLKLMFSKIDISVTTARAEAKYVNSGRGRPRYPVRSMLLALLFMRFEAVPSMRKLCRKLERNSTPETSVSSPSLRSTTLSVSSSPVLAQTRLKVCLLSLEIKRSTWV